jgi:hypothetical protein
MKPNSLIIMSGQYQPENPTELVIYIVSISGRASSVPSRIQLMPRPIRREEPVQKCKGNHRTSIIHLAHQQYY